MDTEPTNTPVRLARHRRIRFYSLYVAAATLMLAAVVAYFTLAAASATDVTVGPLRVELSLRPSWTGSTVVEIPPAGAVEADTHTAPVAVAIAVKEITVTDIDELTDPESETLRALENWQEPVRREMVKMVARGVLIAALAGALVAGALRRGWKWGLGGAVTGALVAVVLGATAYATYDVSAFSEPNYTGSLARAPEIIAFSEQTLANLDTYGDRVPEIAESLYRTVSELHQLPAEFPEGETIRVLHVSDLHNSPAGASLISRVAGLYSVDMVIDTGDTAELGLAAEADYPRSYLPLPAPYIWIAGNHDKPEMAAAMAEVPGVTVLKDSFTEAAGLTIGGFFDPAARVPGPESLADAQIAEDAERIAAVVAAHQPRSFLVAVHDPRQGARLAGLVPVVLNGHTHNAGIAVRDGTVFLDAGTTGGGGYRGFEDERESPSSLQVLYVQKKPLKLLAVDSITIYGFSQEFNIKRRIFSSGEGRLMQEEALAPGASSSL